MNKLIILATLSRFALSYTTGGTPVLEGTLAYTRSVTNPATGETSRVPVFLPFQMLGSAAESAANTLKAGMSVAADGSVQYEEWENANKVRSSRLRTKVLSLNQTVESAPVLTDHGQQGDTLRMDGGHAHAFIKGRLRTLPRVTETRAGKLVTFTLITTEHYRNRENKPVSRDHEIPVNLWREEAEAFLAANVQPGQDVMVSGELVSESWTNGQGVKRSSIVVTGTQFALLVPATAVNGTVAPQPQAQVAPLEATAPQAQPGDDVSTSSVTMPDGFDLIPDIIPEGDTIPDLGF